MNRLATLNDKQRNFLELMGCDNLDIDKLLEVELTYKARLARHSGLHVGEHYSPSLSQIAGWQ